mmetsp:Transcript_9305/g.23691  ORF Transcript_9305/g.23691 Transcript_9305/m.23691 type:complete len:87 (+) Transcript_9305:3-263(+)
MPVMDGFTATKLLREEKYSGAILAVTGNSLGTDLDRLRTVGCNDVLVKPVKNDELVDKVRRWATAKPAQVFPDARPGLPAVVLNAA